MENNAHVSSIVSKEEPLSKQVYSSPPKEAQSTNDIAPQNVHKAKGLARKLPSMLIGLENNRTNLSIVIENNHFCQQQWVPLHCHRVSAF